MNMCTPIYLKLYIGHPESKECVRTALAQVIHHMAQTWHQVVFTCSKHPNIPPDLNLLLTNFIFCIHVK